MSLINFITLKINVLNEFLLIPKEKSLFIIIIIIFIIRVAIIIITTIFIMVQVRELLKDPQQGAQFRFIKKNVHFFFNENAQDLESYPKKYLI